MGNPVVHFEVTGKDGSALRDFYSGMFGWEFQVMEAMDYGMVEAKDRGIGGGVGTAQSGSGHVTFYVEVDDPDAYLEKAGTLGGTTVMPTMEIPGVVTFALLADPEGHMVGVVKSEG